MFTTATPGAQALSIVRSAATPPNAAPYPTEVGTATTGADTRPATTPGRAPSIPATTTSARALRSRSRRASTRCRPATPTSTTSSHARPRYSAVSAASRATGRSEVPAASTTTRPPVGEGGCPGQATIRASGEWYAPGSSTRSAATWSGQTRVNNARTSRRRTSAAIVRTWSADLPTQSIASGNPQRATRSRSSPAKADNASGGTHPSDTTHADQRQGERPRLHAHQVEGHEPEPGRADDPHNLVAQRGGRHRGNAFDRDLQPGDVTVVPDPQVTQTEPTQLRLRSLDLRELLGRDLEVVRDPGGQTRGRGLVCARQVERPGDAPYGRLVHSRVGQRSQDRVHGGRPRPGTVGAPRIIGVLAIGHGGQPMGDHDLLRDPGEELVLAVEAPVDVVAAVLGPVTLVSLHLDDINTDAGSDRMRRHPLVCREARRNPEHRDHPFRTQGPRGKRQQ